MSNPKVSVILPAYNAAGFIAEAVESVRAQTYDDYELLTVDDGSSDATADILDELASGFAKMRVIRQGKNQGLAAARNRAISEMKGEYIALLDADDLWLEQKLQQCLTFLDEHPSLSIVYTPMTPITFDGKKMQGHCKKCHAGQLSEKLFMSIFVHDPATVFHKRVITQCGGFNESIPVCIGHDFWLRVSAKFAFGLIDKPLALRRWSEQSLTRSNRLRARTIKASMLERFYFEQGGADFLPRNEAMRRLAKVHYHVGKSLLTQSKCRQARTYFAKAIRFRRYYARVYLYYLAALVRGVLR